jgi:LysM repeat protein
MKRQICLIGFAFAFVSWGFAQAGKTQKTVEKEQQLYYAHEVTKGQTVYGLCKLYGVTEKEFYKYNPQTEKGLKLSEIVYILISPLKVETYSVKKGETYYSIAKNRGITEEELKKLNPDKGTVLGIGEIIYVPFVESEDNIVTNISTPKSKKEERKERAEEKKSGNTAAAKQQTVIKNITHTVEQGESLYAIARKYGVTVEAIKAANPSLTDALTIGQQIIIPIEETTQEGTKPT